MKAICLFLAALIGTSSLSHAFTLNAVGYDGGVLAQNPEAITIPGYGELIFEAIDSASLVVNSAYQNDDGSAAPSLNFQAGDAVKITFSGATPVNLDFDFVGISVGQSFIVQKDLLSTQAFLVTLEGSEGGAGLESISWDTENHQVPEPASALLGSLGCTLLLARRRR